MSRFRRFVAAMAAIAAGPLLALGTSVPAQAQPPAAAATAPAGFLPSSTSWTSASDGWVFGWSPCDTGMCATLLHTADGGATWSRAGAPAVKPSNVGDRTRIFFATWHGDSIGLLTDSHTLYVSYDGARTWQPLTLPGADMISGIGANRQSVFVVAHAQSGGQITAQAFATAIAKPRWHPVDGLTATSPGTLYSTHSAVAGSGKAIQVATSAVAYGDNVATLWTAVNGHRFRAVSPCDPRARIFPGVAPSGRQFVLCSTIRGLGHTDKLLLTGDADDYFTTVAGVPPALGDTTDFAVAGDSTVAIAALGGAALVYVSFDGGKTWTLPVLEPRAGSAHDLDFQDARHGVVVTGDGAFGFSAVYRTTDGGHTWTELHF